jgi:hypothetical protein
MSINIIHVWTVLLNKFNFENIDYKQCILFESMSIQILLCML